MKKQRGGVRKNAGAPKKEPTKVITTRVRLSEEQPVRTAIKATIAKIRAAAIMLLLPIMASSQLIPSVGFGLSATHYNTHIKAEIGTMVSNFGYVGIAATGNHQGFNIATIAPMAGSCWSWNNGKGHDLTTMFFIKYDVPVIAVKHKATGAAAIGFRHYVYRAYFEMTANQYKRVDITFGWTFRDIYR